MPISEERLEERIVSSFLASIRPLIESMVIDFEITYPMIVPGLRATFIEAAKNIAREELDSDDVATSVLALKTGLSAKSIRETPKLDAAIKNAGLSGISRLLGVWSSNSEWSDDEGEPKKLPLQGTYGEQNFETLVRKTMGNLSYGPVVEALTKSMCVSHIRLSGKKALQLEKAFYIPASKQAAESFETGCAGIKALATTVRQNVTWSDFPPNQRHIQGTIQSRNISIENIKAFRSEIRTLQRRFLNEQLIPKMKSIEESTSNGSQIAQAGLGFYFFELHDQDSQAPQYPIEDTSDYPAGW